MDVPDGLRYTQDHEWLRLESGEGVVGITAYAADELGDVVFVELPKVGRIVQRAEAFGVIESVKTASDLYAPLAGAPELVNQDPYGEGWMIRIRPEDAAEVDGLLEASAYRALVDR